MNKDLVERLAWIADQCDHPIGMYDAHPEVVHMLRRATAAIRSQDGLVAGLKGALEGVPLPGVQGDAAEFYGRFYDWYYRSAVPALAPFEDPDAAT